MRKILAILLCILLLGSLLGCQPPEQSQPPLVAYEEVNNNVPYFTKEDIANGLRPFEEYSELDYLGRCGVAYANICVELMPTEKRGEIGMIKPSGWHTVRYDDLVDGKYLYNRCHLIGFQLAGENANPKNLITGTRFLNVQGMLPFENQVADYVKETENHVLYRVTPMYDGSNLLANGVLIEAQSVEDDSLSFCVFCPNVQPGVTIDYATGESWRDEDYVAPTEEPVAKTTYVLNTNSMKFHNPDCSSVASISDHNRVESTLTREALIQDGYSPCGSCKP